MPAVSPHETRATSIQIQDMKNFVIHQLQSRSIFRVTQITGLIALCAFVIDKALVPVDARGWSIPPMVDGFVLLVLGAAFSVATIIYCHRAWNLSVDEFNEWYYAQQFVFTNWVRRWYRHYPVWHLRFIYRYLGPLGFLMSLAMIGMGLVALLTPYYVP